MIQINFLFSLMIHFFINTGLIIYLKTVTCTQAKTVLTVCGSLNNSLFTPKVGTLIRILLPCECITNTNNESFELNSHSG